MMSKALNEEARAIGAFAFSLNGVGTQSQSVNQNDTARHVSTRLREMSGQGWFGDAADRWEQRQLATDMSM
jgi:hypothetical protein